MRSEQTAFFRSIRFRLSAWYALLLFILIVLLGAGVAFKLEREQRQDVDTRLESTAKEMVSQFTVSPTPGGAAINVPPPDAFSFPSQLIQVVDEKGQVYFSSENLENRTLPIVGGDAGASPRFDTEELDGVRIRTLTYPIQLRGRVVGAVNVAEPLIQLNQMLRDLRRQILFAAVVGAGLAALAGWFLAGRALKPVDTMVESARSITSQSSANLALSNRLDVPPAGDELSRLATTFNDMLSRIEVAFNTQRQFVADASHELRTPLTAIRGNVDLVQRQIEREEAATPEVDRTLTDLRRESARMARLIDDLLTLARSESPGGLPLNCETVNLAEIARDAARTAQAAGSGPTISIESPDLALVEGDRDRLEQVMLILCENSTRLTPADGEISLVCSIDGTAARFSVRDTGPGIAPADLPRVFDRFYRADESRERSKGGTGLGLAIARAIVTAHSGQIRVRSEVNKGTIFDVSLPRHGGCRSVGSKRQAADGTALQANGALPPAVRS
jgi:signal transduction histidine kinase